MQTVCLNIAYLQDNFGTVLTVCSNILQMSAAYEYCFTVYTTSSSWYELCRNNLCVTIIKTHVLPSNNSLHDALHIYQKLMFLHLFPTLFHIDISSAFWTSARLERSLLFLFYLYMSIKPYGEHSAIG